MRIADRIVDTMVQSGVIEPAETALYQYGVEIFILKTTAIIIAALIGHVLGTLRILIWLLIFFIPVRKYSGGIHASTPTRCLIISELLLVICQEVVQKVNFVPEVCTVLLASSLILIICLSPNENDNKELTVKQRNKYKVYVIIICFICGAIFCCTVHKGVFQISKIITTAFVMQTFLLIVAQFKQKIVCSGRL